MKTIYLSLGSNQGNREAYLQEAIDRLSQARVCVLRISSVYETEPQDFPDQPWFLNLVLEASTELFPMQLLSRIQAIETELGRSRRIPKGPRTIDIDILLFGRFIVDAPRLVIPHPRLHQRRFVLEPLAEIAPELRHPVFRKSMRELLEGTKDQAVRKSAFRPALPGA